MSSWSSWSSCSARSAGRDRHWSECRCPFGSFFACDSGHRVSSSQRWSLRPGGGQQGGAGSAVDCLDRSVRASQAEEGRRVRTGVEHAARWMGGCGRCAGDGTSDSRWHTLGLRVSSTEWPGRRAVVVDPRESAACSSDDEKRESSFGVGAGCRYRPQLIKPLVPATDSPPAIGSGSQRPRGPDT